MSRADHGWWTPRRLLGAFGACILLAGVAVGILILRHTPNAEAGVVPLSLPTPTGTAAAGAAAPEAPAASGSACHAGWPTGFTWPDLGIRDAPIQRIGSTDGVPDAPDDSPRGRLGIGVYQETVGDATYGHLPGQGLGNIIIDGHTYADDSAVFKSNADEHIREGSVFWFTMDDGSVCSYRVSQVFHQLKKDPPVEAGHEMFSDVAVREKFYDLAHEGERVLGMTCSGEFDAQGAHHLFETAWFAAPA